MDSMIIKCNNRKCQAYQIDSANIASNIDIIDMNLPIKKHVLCNHCRTGWIICTVCNKTFSMKNMYQANTHFNEKHNSVDSMNLNEIEINLHHDDDESYGNDNFSISTLSFDDSQTDNRSGNGKQLISNTTLIGDASNSDMSLHHKEYFKTEIEQQVQGLKI